MADRTKKLRWPLWVAIAAAILLAGAWLVQSLMAQPDETSQDRSQATTETLDMQPQVIDTNDAYTRYVQALNADGVTNVKESHIYPANDVNWNEEVVVAIRFSTLDARTFTSASIETIDGEESYVIDLIDASSCGATTQIHTDRVAFIKQTSREASLPVILRVTPNTTECPAGL